MQEITRKGYRLCWRVALGLRFSDWHKIKKENILEIKGQLILSIKDQKRDNYLAVPLNLIPLYYSNFREIQLQTS
jgi:hypothetical protein